MREASGLSVVVPTYCGGEFILAALESVFDQTRVPDEIVVVDDASTDDTVAIVERTRSSAPCPINIIARRQNSGTPAVPLNQGLAAAHGELVAILDQDDMFEPNKLAVQSGILDRHPVIGFAGALCDLVATNFDSSEDHAAAAPNDLPRAAKRMAEKVQQNLSFQGEFWRGLPRELVDLLVDREQFLIGFPGFTFRKSLWAKKGGFDENLFNAADYDFLCWMATRTQMAFVPQIHYRRREHANNLTHHEIRRLAEVVRVLAGMRSEVRSHLVRDRIAAAIGHKLHRMAIFLAVAGYWRESLDMSAAVGRVDPRWSGWFRRATATMLLPWKVAKRRKRQPEFTADGEEARKAIAEVHAILRAA